MFYSFVFYFISFLKIGSNKTYLH